MIALRYLPTLLNVDVDVDVEIENVYFFVCQGHPTDHFGKISVQKAFNPL